MNADLSDKLMDLAGKLSYASGVKEVARLRRQCALVEWEQVVEEAKKIVARRRATIPAQRRVQGKLSPIAQRQSARLLTE